MIRFEITMFTFYSIISTVFCQNPITDSDFYKAYTESDIVSYSKDAYDLDYKICAYLVGDTSLEKKMAVIDAFNTEAELDAGRLFLQFLKSKYGYPDVSEINNDEHKLILSYLLMTSEIEISKSLLKEVETNYQNRLSYNVLKFFVTSFENLENNKCKVWSDFQKLDNRKFQLNDFNSEAMTLIAKKIDDYKDYCSQENLVLTQTKRNFAQEFSSSNTFDLNYENGVYSIALEINKVLELDFIFDSGASVVLIPEDVFRVLLRLNAIKKEHMLGLQEFTIADGSTMKKPVFLIESLKIGNIEVNNIEAAVGELNSNLLLGQSFQKEFKLIKIDNKNNKLIIDK